METMKTQTCPVEACGARVMFVTVAGRPLPVNPIRVELVVPGEGPGYRLVAGYLPHRQTCLDISLRGGAERFTRR